MRFSILVPTLDEAGEIEGALASIPMSRSDVEVIVADGGSRDGTLDRVLPHRARSLVSARGRAAQLNAAARLASGEIVIVLHADCRLPTAALEAVEKALCDRGVVGGAFHKRFRSSHRLLRSVRRRTATWHRLGWLFGDQAMFIRRDALRLLGGFRVDVAAEDLDMALRLRGLGRLVLLDPEVEVSARRLETRGIPVTWLGWWVVGARQVLRGLAERTDPPGPGI